MIYLLLQDLQDDYKRFMDYTEGRYHSDYMMVLRNHGMKLANRKVSVVTYQDIQELDKEDDSLSSLSASLLRP